MEVEVRDDLEKAIKILKKKLQREGVFRKMKLMVYFEKPSDKRARKLSESVRRSRKLERKKRLREGG